MVASRRTISDAALAVVRHMPRVQALALLDDLARVEGNASFAQTVVLVRDAVADGPDDLLPEGVLHAASGAANYAYPFFASTDLDRLGQPLIRAESLADAAAQTAALAATHPGNMIYLQTTVAAYCRPRDRPHVLRHPIELTSRF